MRREKDGQQEPPLAHRAWEHRAAKDRTPFLPPVTQSPVLCAHCRQEVQAPAAPGTCWQFPPGSSWEAGPPAQGRSVLFVGRRQLGFDSPICLSLVISPSGPSELSLLGGQRIWGGSFFQTKSSVKEIPENTIIALDYFLQFMTLSCPRSRSVYSTGIWTNEPAHSHTLTPTLSHTHPSLCCILGETGLRDGLWCSAIPSSGVSAALRLSLELG